MKTLGFTTPFDSPGSDFLFFIFLLTYFPSHLLNLLLR